MSALSLMGKIQTLQNILIDDYRLDHRAVWEIGRRSKSLEENLSALINLKQCTDNDGPLKLTGEIIWRVFHQFIKDLDNTSFSSRNYTFKDDLFSINKVGGDYAEQAHLFGVREMKYKDGRTMQTFLWLGTRMYPASWQGAQRDEVGGKVPDAVKLKSLADFEKTGVGKWYYSFILSIQKPADGIQPAGPKLMYEFRIQDFPTVIGGVKQASTVPPWPWALGAMREIVNRHRTLNPDIEHLPQFGLHVPHITFGSLGWREDKQSTSATSQVSELQKSCDSEAELLNALQKEIATLDAAEQGATVQIEPLEAGHQGPIAEQSNSNEAGQQQIVSPEARQKASTLQQNGTLESTPFPQQSGLEPEQHAPVIQQPCTANSGGQAPLAENDNQAPAAQQFENRQGQFFLQNQTPYLPQTPPHPQTVEQLRNFLQIKSMSAPARPNPQTPPQMYDNNPRGIMSVPRPGMSPAPNFVIDFMNGGQQQQAGSPTTASASPLCSQMNSPTPAPRSLAQTKAGTSARQRKSNLTSSQASSPLPSMNNMPSTVPSHPTAHQRPSNGVFPPGSAQQHMLCGQSPQPLPLQALPNRVHANATSGAMMNGASPNISRQPIPNSSPQLMPNGAHYFMATGKLASGHAHHRVSNMPAINQAMSEQDQLRTMQLQDDLLRDVGSVSSLQTFVDQSLHGHVSALPQHRHGFAQQQQVIPAQQQARLSGQQQRGSMAQKQAPPRVQQQQKPVMPQGSPRMPQRKTVQQQGSPLVQEQRSIQNQGSPQTQQHRAGQQQKPALQQASPQLRQQRPAQQQGRVISQQQRAIPRPGQGLPSAQNQQQRHGPASYQGSPLAQQQNAAFVQQPRFPHQQQGQPDSNHLFFAGLGVGNQQPQVAGGFGHGQQYVPQPFMPAPYPSTYQPMNQAQQDMFGMGLGLGLDGVDMDFMNKMGMGMGMPMEEMGVQGGGLPMNINMPMPMAGQPAEGMPIRMPQLGAPFRVMPAKGMPMAMTNGMRKRARSEEEPDEEEQPDTQRRRVS